MTLDDNGHPNTTFNMMLGIWWVQAHVVMCCHRGYRLEDDPGCYWLLPKLLTGCWVNVSNAVAPVRKPSCSTLNCVATLPRIVVVSTPLLTIVHFILLGLSETFFSRFWFWLWALLFCSCISWVGVGSSQLFTLLLESSVCKWWWLKVNLHLQINRFIDSLPGPHRYSNPPWLRDERLITVQSFQALNEESQRTNKEKSILEIIVSEFGSYSMCNSSSCSVCEVINWLDFLQMLLLLWFFTKTFLLVKYFTCVD